VAAGAAAGDLLDDDAGMDGQLHPLVQDAELAVLDDDAIKECSVGGHKLFPGVRRE
jgi:hypothetical protein